uniref:Uncharacterized protein n=1 Tax=Timema tahoe TaxID=61484 RepID=A0A7R9IS37_9NEOP|nr:unnamed protein product [Timema tahoe]
MSFYISGYVLHCHLEQKNLQLPADDFLLVSYTNHGAVSAQVRSQYDSAESIEKGSIRLNGTDTPDREITRPTAPKIYLPRESPEPETRRNTVSKNIKTADTTVRKSRPSGRRAVARRQRTDQRNLEGIRFARESTGGAARQSQTNQKCQGYWAAMGASCGLYGFSFSICHMVLSMQPNNSMNWDQENQRNRNGVIVNLAVPERKAVATPKLKEEGLRGHKPPNCRRFEQPRSDYTQQQKLILKPGGRNKFSGVWRDLKRNTRGRAAAINAAHRQTGNPNVENKLSDLDKKKVIAVIGRDFSTGIPDLSAIGLCTDLSSHGVITPSSRSSSSSQVAATNLAAGPSTQRATQDVSYCGDSPPLMPSSKTNLNPKSKRANDPEISNQSEILPTPKSAKKRKQCDDYDNIFLQKFTQMQEVNINNARTTGDQIKILGDAATKIGTAAGTMATVAQETQKSFERLATAITKLADCYSKK